MTTAVRLCGSNSVLSVFTTRSVYGYVCRIMSVQSTSLITTLSAASEMCRYSQSVVIPQVSVGWDFALGMEILSLFANCRYIRSRCLRSWLYAYVCMLMCVCLCVYAYVCMLMCVCLCVYACYALYSAGHWNLIIRVKLLPYTPVHTVCRSWAAALHPAWLTLSVFVEQPLCHACNSCAENTTFAAHG